MHPLVSHPASPNCKLLPCTSLCPCNSAKMQGHPLRVWMPSLVQEGLLHSCSMHLVPCRMRKLIGEALWSSAGRDPNAFPAHFFWDDFLGLVGRRSAHCPRSHELVPSRAERWIGNLQNPLQNSCLFFSPGLCAQADKNLFGKEDPSYDDRMFSTSLALTALLDLHSSERCACSAGPAGAASRCMLPDTPQSVYQMIEGGLVIDKSKVYLRVLVSILS